MHLRRPPLLQSPPLFFFFFNDTATTEIYTLSLHDALPISGPRHDRRSGRRGGRLEVSRVPGVAGGLAELAFPQRERAVKPGVAAVAGGDVEGRGDPPDRVAWTGAGRVAAAFELDLGAVAGGGPDNWRRRAHGAAGLFEQGPFERAGQLRPVDRAIAAADEGAVALPGQRRHPGLVVEFCLEEGL